MWNDELCWRLNNIYSIPHISKDRERSSSRDINDYWKSEQIEGANIFVGLLEHDGLS